MNKKTEKCEHEYLTETLIQVYSWDDEHVMLEIQDYCKNKDCGEAFGEPYLRKYIPEASD